MKVDFFLVLKLSLLNLYVKKILKLIKDQIQKNIFLGYKSLK